MSEALLTQVAAGSSTALEDCIAAYGRLVWSIARNRLGNREDVEDAVQEVFIEVWRSSERFDPEVSSEANFISTIARRRLVDQIRKRSRLPDTQPVSQSLRVEDPGAAASIEKTDSVERIREKMEELRPEERRVLELSHIEGLSQTRISEVTDLPLGTVKTHARRGLESLRALLKSDR